MSFVEGLALLSAGDVLIWFGVAVFGVREVSVDVGILIPTVRPTFAAWHTCFSSQSWTFVMAISTSISTVGGGVGVYTWLIKMDNICPISSILESWWICAALIYLAMTKNTTRVVSVLETVISSIIWILKTMSSLRTVFRTSAIIYDCICIQDRRWL